LKIVEEDALEHHTEYNKAQRSSLAAIDHSMHWLYSSSTTILPFSLPFTCRGKGVKKLAAKVERIGCEVTRNAEQRDRLARSELRTTAASGSIMRKLVKRALLTLRPNVRNINASKYTSVYQQYQFR
jgi:hypothetical protein